MNIIWAIVWALIIQAAESPVLYGPALAYHYVQCSINIWYSELQSASRLSRSRIIAVGAIIAMHVAVLGCLMAGVDLPTLLSVTAAIVITTGWAVIAYTAVKMASGLWGDPSTKFLTNPNVAYTAAE